MTTVGKGRGWGRNTEDSGLRKPAPPPGISDELIERIRRIDVNDLTGINEPSSPVTDIVPNRSYTENITKLYNEALEDRSFISNFLAIFSHPSNNAAALMTILQPDYDGREQFSKKFPAKFLNFTCLMGEVLLRPTIFMRPEQMYGILSIALINLCKILLESAEEEEIEVVMTQIWLNGKALKTTQPKALAELMTRIKEVLISRNLSNFSRAMLLFSIEIAHNNYATTLDSDVEQLYESHLKGITKELMRKRTVAAVSEAKFAEPIDKKEEQRKIPEKQSPPRYTPNPVPNTKKIEEKEPQKPPQAGQRGPRAIRGSGVNGSRDEEKKNARKSPSHWTDGKKGWGHDDRFERDY